MTDITEPINTTSDGTFLSVVCENTKKVLLAKCWGAVAPPAPPRNYPPDMCVCRGPKSVGGITWAKNAHAQSQYWAVKSNCSS